MLRLEEEKCFLTIETVGAVDCTVYGEHCDLFLEKKTLLYEVTFHDNHTHFSTRQPVQTFGNTSYWNIYFLYYQV